MFSRRSFFLGMPVIALGIHPHSNNRHFPINKCDELLHSRGCCLIDDEAADVATERLASSLQSTSGNPKLDRYLGKALVRLADTFGVDPGFGFMDDAQLPRPNAFAMNKTLIPGTQGTVMFGLQLFNKTMSKRHDQGLSVLVICAHEFGHIVQFETQYYTELSRGQRELSG